jgi:hypothetical protein
MSGSVLATAQKMRLQRCNYDYHGIPRSSSVATQANAQRQPLIEMPTVYSDVASSAIEYESHADIAHSEENILLWMSFLPEDCIRTMVLMGWDIST